MTVRTRFAPSPTGFLHIGNARTALINYLFALKNSGEFILRIDDTDLTRSKKEYEDQIINDLNWLGFRWNKIFHQSDRLEKYEQAKEFLIKEGRLYECYETPEELDIKRKIQLSSGKPPIYDRAALKLSDKQKEDYKKQGRKPHYRFKLDSEIIRWDDMVKGNLTYQPVNLSDPIVIREDGSMTYMICSTIDDIDFEITHVIRGEDHVSNTAIQVQMFKAFNKMHPIFGHLSLVKSKDDKISKRVGGFEIESLRANLGIEAMTINSFLSKIGTSESISFEKNLQDLSNKFDLSNFSKSPTTYMPEELERLNHKYLISMDYLEVKHRLDEIGMTDVTEEFWHAVKNNLQFLKDIKIWWNICNNFEKKSEITAIYKDYLALAATKLPEGNLDENSWKIWTDEISKETGKKGKELFLPLRLAITGNEQGPELKYLLPIIGREGILSRI